MNKSAKSFGEDRDVAKEHLNQGKKTFQDEKPSLFYQEDDQVVRRKIHKKRGGKPRTSWLRWLFYILLIFCFLAVVLVLTTLFVIRSIYEGKAAKFDLSKIEQMESASLVYDRNGLLLGTIYIQNRDTVPLEKVAFVLQQAVIAAEDARFYNHRGADYIRILGAALKNYRARRITQGGSTITQQLARNSFELRERSFERKLVEIFLAARIERHFSKKRILELYLNRIYFGSGFYGIEAAAQGYFGKPASELTASESAMLAGLIKSPNNFSPWTNRRASMRERDEVLRRMRELKMLSKKQYEDALQDEPRVRSRQSIKGGGDTYAMELIRQRVIAEVGFEGATSEGYRIHTTIDSRLQQEAERSLRDRLAEIERRPGFTHQTLAAFEKEFSTFLTSQRDAQPPAEGEETSQPPVPKYLQGALIAIDNSDGGIISIVGGRDFRHSEFNRAIQARRPPGTAFTPFVYAAAFEAGLFPGTLLDDAAMDNRQVMIGGTTGILGEWGAERFENRYEGRIPARHALVKGKNAATARVGASVGLGPIINLAKRAGISSDLREFPSTFLGSSEVTLQELVLAYSIFPNEGWRPTRTYIISRITSKEGRPVFTASPKRIQVLNARIAYQIHTALSDIIEWGTADKALTRFGLKRVPAGGKTGTAYDFTDVTFVGYTSAITCGVWAGFDKPQQIYRGAFSSDITLPIWVDYINATIESYKPRPFEQPYGLRRVEVDLSTGLIVNSPAPPGVTRNTTFELVTEEQIAIGSDIDRGLTAARAPEPKGEWPRATLAVDLSSIPPLPIKSPAVIGEDPYGTVTPEIFTEKSSLAPSTSSEEEEVEVRRAETVRPVDDPRERPLLLDIPRPPPIEF